MAVQRDPESPKLIGARSHTVEEDSGPRPLGSLRRSVKAEPAREKDVPPSRSRGEVAAAPSPRLELLEALLELDEPGRCAQLAIDWLWERAKVKQAMCVVVDPERSRLISIAGRGLPWSSHRELPVSVNDRDHKLVKVLVSGEPAVFKRDAAGDPPASLFANASFLAAPLETEAQGSREPRGGLLLTSVASPRAASEVAWVARVLGRKLLHLAAASTPTRAYELDLKVRAATTALIQQNDLLNQQNEMLNGQRVALEQASSMKSQFLANMSHELRTPLNAILGYTSMLLQGIGGDLSSKQAQMMSRVDSNGRSLLSLINDILDIARIEAGKMPIHFAEIRVTDIVPELLAELEPVITRSKLAVVTETSEVPLLRTDRQKVKQILLNLLTNALKFTPKGSVTVRTAYDPAVRHITVSVADTGIGVSESDQATIFTDFQQADSSPTRQYGGAGLGLSICRRLAAMLGGHITLTSRLEQGSTFTLVLPRQARHR